MSSGLDDEVVIAAQDGKPTALRAVFDNLSPAVLGYLTARGSEDPEGLTSEVFLAVFSRLAAVTGGAKGLRTFVFSVAHARLVDDQRRRARRPVTVPYEPEDDQRTTAPAEDDALAAVSTSELLEVLNRLAPEQRDVILLRIVADLSLEEVAQVVAKSVGAVKQLQRRGLVRLRAVVSELGVTR